MPKCKVELIPGYYSWKSAKDRCNYPGATGYPRYGGRGIKFCAEWDRFAAFHADMGDRPEGCELDRIDNEGDYCAENCRWVTRIEQHRNKRNNVLITYAGRTMCVAAWAEELGIGRATLRCRWKRGWSVERCLTTPVRRRGLCA